MCLIKSAFTFLLIISCIVFVYLRYYEKKCIYFPTTEIAFTPSDAGLTYEDVFFKTQDDLELNGWFIPAKNTQKTVIICHGNAGNIGDRLGVVEIFHALGLNIFIFDYRGYGRSQGAPDEEGLYLDAQAAYQYLLQNKDVEKKNIIIYGKSLGAGIAVDLASRVEVAALIADSGITSAYEMGRKLFPAVPVGLIITVKLDSLAKIKEISIPKLVIHSINDELVPFSMGEKLFEAAPEPKQFYRAQGSHNDAIFTQKQQYISEINDFLKKHALLP